MKMGSVTELLLMSIYICWTPTFSRQGWSTKIGQFQQSWWCLAK